MTLKNSEQGLEPVTSDTKFFISDPAHLDGYRVSHFCLVGLRKEKRRKKKKIKITPSRNIFTEKRSPSQKFI